MSRPYCRKNPVKETKYGIGRTVYLSMEEDQMLQKLCEINNLPISQIMKQGIKEQYQKLNLEVLKCDSN